MADRPDSFSVLEPEEQHWRPSNIMKIPNTDLLQQLGGNAHMGGRLWRLPPFSANTWHRHPTQWEFYFVLEGKGRIRIGEECRTVPRYGSVLVAPEVLRQVFNDTPEECLWLIVGAPQDQIPEGADPASVYYPEDPKSLPRSLVGHAWPPEG